MARHARPQRSWVRAGVGTAAAAALLVTPALAGAPQALAAVVPTTYHAALTPTSTVAGTTTNYTFTVANTSPPTSDFVFNAVTVAVATGFTATTVGTVTPPTGEAWTAALASDGATIKLHGATVNDQLLPGQSVSVAITSTAPQTAGSYPWNTTASNDLIGVSFTDDTAQPTVTVEPAATSQLVFTQQPTDTQVGQPISPVVQVQAEDAFGNPTPSFAGPVTLSYAANPGNAPTPSNNTATASNGTASFPGLSIATAGIGYQLQAASGTLTSAPSAKFNEYSVQVICQPAQPCDTGTQTAGNTSADDMASAGPTTDVLTLTIGGFAAPTCGSTYVNKGQVVTHDVTGNTRTQTVTYTLLNVFATSDDDEKEADDDEIGPSNYGICFEDPHPFLTASGAPATVNPSTGEYQGQLPKCSNSPAPCLISSKQSGANDVLTYFVGPGDPHSIGDLLPL